MAQDIKTSLDKLKTALTGDKTALTGKKVSVPSGAKHSDIPTLIDGIKTGLSDDELRSIREALSEKYVTPPESMTPEEIDDYIRQIEAVKQPEKHELVYLNNVYLGETSAQTKLVFTDEKAPSSVSTTDVSKNGDNSVVKWVEGDTVKISSQKTGVRICISEYLYTEHIVYEHDYAPLNGDWTFNIFQTYYINAGGDEETGYYSSVNSRSYFEYIDLSNADFSTLTSTNSLFSGTGFKTIDLSVATGLDSGNITSTHSMFASTSATTINLGNLNTSNVTDMSGMFSGCSLTSFDMSVLDTSNVMNMERMFSYSKLETINFDGANTEKVVDMSNMFYYSQSLKSLKLNISTKSLITVSNMFASCNHLTSLDLSEFDLSNVKEADGLFKSLSALQQLKLKPGGFGKVKDFTETFSWLPFTTLDLSNQDFSKAKICVSMFEGCSATEIRLPKTGNRSLTNCLNMFKSCRKLTTLNTGNLSFYNIEGYIGETLNLANMFQGCSDLVTIDLRWIQGGTSNYPCIYYMFDGCSDLTTIIAYEWVDHVPIETRVFEGCYSLPNYNYRNTKASYCKYTTNGGYFTKPT